MAPPRQTHRTLAMAGGCPLPREDLLQGVRRHAAELDRQVQEVEAVPHLVELPVAHPSEGSALDAYGLAGLPGHHLHRRARRDRLPLLDRVGHLDVDAREPASHGLSPLLELLGAANAGATQA